MSPEQKRTKGEKQGPKTWTMKDTGGEKRAQARLLQKPKRGREKKTAKTKADSVLPDVLREFSHKERVREETKSRVGCSSVSPELAAPTEGETVHGTSTSACCHEEDHVGQRQKRELFKRRRKQTTHRRRREKERTTASRPKYRKKTCHAGHRFSQCYRWKTTLGKDKPLL